MIYKTIIQVRIENINSFYFKIKIKKTFLFGFQISYKEKMLPNIF